MRNLKLALMLLLGSILTVSVAAHAEVTTPIEQLVSELAEKPEHHQALVSYYRKKADEAKAEAAKHERMAGAYRHNHQSQKRGTSGRQKMHTHCDRLAKNYLSAAKDYEALAKFHEAEITQD